MEIVLLTNEYPPHIYGGAGVHIEYLSRQLAEISDHNIGVFSFGDQDLQSQNLTVKGIGNSPSNLCQDRRHQKFLDAMLRNIFMTGSVKKADIVHCHTWYSHFAGCLLKELYGAKLILTTHSLEPHRPWKREQLGTAYHASSWIEKTAYQNADGVIAVSESMKRDVQSLYGVSEDKVRIIHNGIDVDHYKPMPNPQLLRSYQIDPNIPYILFVGRITRQKGIIHLVNAIQYLRPDVQIVLCAGAPDTEEIELELKRAVTKAREISQNKIIWISQVLPKNDIVSLYTHACIFVCPSVYEPFGIINLEAMACETPVVASCVGGIPEIIVHDETGLLVPFTPIASDSFEPKNSEKFSQDLARAIHQLLDSPQRLEEMGLKSRKRVEEHFSWQRIANETLAFYQELIKS